MTPWLPVVRYIFPSCPLRHAISDLHLAPFGATSTRSKAAHGEQTPGTVPRSHVSQKKVPRQINNRWEVLCIRWPSSAPVGWALVVWFSLDPRVETVRDRGEYTCTVRSDRIFFVRILALKGGPYPWQADPVRGKPIGGSTSALAVVGSQPLPPPLGS